MTETLLKVASNDVSARARTSIAWTFFNAIGQIATRFLTLVVLSWLLSPADLGYFAIALSLVLILATIAQYGIPANLILIETLLPASFAAAVLVGTLFATVTATVYALGVQQFLADLHPELSRVLVVFAPFVVLQVLLNILDGVARRIFAFREIALCELGAAALGGLPISIVLAYHGWGPWSLMAGHVAAAMLQAAGLLYVCRRFLGVRTSVSDIRNVMKSGFFLTIAESANLATVHGQRPLIGIELGVAAAGLWTRFYQIILLQLTCLIQPVDRLVVPTLARANSRSTETMLLLIEVVGLITVPVSVMTIFASPYLVGLVFGPGWLDIVLPLQIGAITLFFRGIDRLLLSGARAMGHMRSRAAAQIIQLAFVMACVYVATGYGLPAVSAAYVGAQACCLLLMLRLFGHATQTRFPVLLRRLVPGATCGIMTACVGVWLGYLLSPGLSAEGIAASSAVMAMAVAISLYCLVVIGPSSELRSLLASLALRMRLVDLVRSGVLR